MSIESRKATTAELREFLAQMRGKSPKEMLGTIASSNLAQSTVAATAVIIAVIVLLTLVPFGLKKAFGGSADEVTSKTATEAVAPSEPLETPAEPSLDGSPTKTETANKLGIGESKSAPANVNPLESSTDDLLKDFE